MCAGAATGAAGALGRTVDVEPAAGVSGHHIEAKTPPTPIHRVRENIGERRDIVDEARRSGPSGGRISRSPAGWKTVTTPSTLAVSIQA